MSLRALFIFTISDKRIDTKKKKKKKKRSKAAKEGCDWNTLLLH